MEDEMKRKKVRLLAVMVLIVVIGAGLWWSFGRSSSDLPGTILASGFIEARDVSIAAETGGRIAEISADEGDHIAAGTTLIRLDDSLLMAQKRQAEANVNLARAYLEQAVIARDGAEKAWENALEVQRNPMELESRIITAEGELALAELNLAKAEELETEWNLAVAEIQLDTAQKLLENFERAEHTVGMGSQYDRMAKTIPAAGELAIAELNLDYQTELIDYFSIPAAELRVATAQKALQNLLAIRDNPQELNTIVDNTHNAYQASVVAAEAAELQVEQAEASLNVINVQIDKLTVASPVSGVVASRHAEAGEIAQPGLPILSVTELDEVTLTAYIPERAIGLVKLGQEVQVSVDSYPDEYFSGTIVYISPNALFTPKNIQLKDEREKMVFAVKIRLANLEQKLKPGMPADARILTGVEGE
ncbi:MAG: HlyD family efflux transporter periplasmic adaptor subunit [Dehalococcoidia bacterium]|nr:HlyD family efflux transporter periplasmic adaptor subunit [Dehalococcoidia bacterium]